MELRHLRYFVAVVEERQFVRAAARLHLAQSALSQQIRDLEADLGTTLLVRDRRGVTPTAAGEVLVRHARTMLDQAQDARAEIDQLAGVVTGRLRVGTGSPSGPVSIAAALAALTLRHPRVEIALQDTTSDELLRWLDEGIIDVAIVSRMPDQIPARYERDLIAREPLLVLVPADHPLAGRRALPLAALAGEPLVTFPRGPAAPDQRRNDRSARGPRAGQSRAGGRDRPRVVCRARRYDAAVRRARRGGPRAPSHPDLVRDASRGTGPERVPGACTRGAAGWVMIAP